MNPFPTIYSHQSKVAIFITCPATYETAEEEVAGLIAAIKTTSDELYSEFYNYIMTIEITFNSWVFTWNQGWPSEKLINTLHHYVAHTKGSRIAHKVVEVRGEKVVEE